MLTGKRSGQAVRSGRPNLCNERAYISKDRVWREIDEELANEPTIIDWIADGQFNHPIRIVAFKLQRKLVQRRDGKHCIQIARTEQ
jgi:hypothetical protein